MASDCQLPVLVVDDDADLVDTVHRARNRPGWDVWQVGSDETTLDEWRDEREKSG
jgi:hypothetical protein